MFDLKLQRRKWTEQTNHLTRLDVVMFSARGGFFHSKDSWGCAAREGILFRTSSLAKGVLFGNFSRVKSRQGYAFWGFWSKRCQNSVIFEKKNQLF